MLIDALRYLSDPAQEIARASLTLNYTALAAEEEPAAANTADWDARLTAQPQEALPPAFTDRLHELRLMPLYELLEELFSLFGLSRMRSRTPTSLPSSTP